MTTVSPHPHTHIIDLADPIDRLRRQVVRHSHRPSRSACFFLGMLFACGAVFVSYTIVNDMRATAKPAPAWNTSAFQYIGQQDGIRYIRNTTDRDIRLHPDGTVVMQKTALGLLWTDSKLAHPAFVPSGDSAGLDIRPTIEGALTLFDTGNHFRIEAHNGQKTTIR